jgi:Organic solvent tolerance protein OstA
MKNKIIILFIFLAVFLVIFFGLNLNKKKELEKAISSQKKESETSYNSNIILDVNYSSVDIKGNEYIINAEKGEIDFTDSSIVYLTNVNAVIKPKLKDVITIKSNFGKYNINNFDTIFTKNVIINYVDNKIVGEYLDFSINRNSMIMSKNVIYSNQDNVLKSDVIEVNLETKDTKIFMYEKSKKVNIKSKNKYGNN